MTTATATTPAAEKVDGMTPDERAAKIAAMGGKPKRARKAKGAPPASKPKRAPRTVPARTLRVRIHDLAGDAGLDAFDHLRKKGGEAYEASVREAMDANDEVLIAANRHEDAKIAEHAARALYEGAHEKAEDTRPVLDRLLLAAKRLASLDADDVEPDAPTDEDRKGVDVDAERLCT